MITNKTIALIAHDSRKVDMQEWAAHNAATLLQNRMVCTGTTGGIIENALTTFTGDGDDILGPVIMKKKSGPMGGDAQISAMIVEGQIDLCVFLIDDLTSNPHEADIQTLLRQCRIHNVPVACNRASADFMITSDLWGTNYISSIPQYIKFIR